MEKHAFELARIIGDICPNGWARGELTGFWYSDGHRKMSLTCFDEAGHKLKYGGLPTEPFDYLDDRWDEMRRDAGGTGDNLPNCFRLTVWPNGQHRVEQWFDPELDSKRSAEIRELLGEDSQGPDYAHSGEPGRQEEPGAPSEADISKKTGKPAAAEPGLTVPQLFGFIHEELTRNVPEDWTSIIVEGEVFEEDGRKAVSMVSWYTTPERPEPVRFVPENSIGPMNALIELNERNAPTGEPWRRIRLVYHTNGVVDVDTDPEAGA